MTLVLPDPTTWIFGDSNNPEALVNGNEVKCAQIRKQSKSAAEEVEVLQEGEAFTFLAFFGGESWSHCSRTELKFPGKTPNIY